MSLFAVKPHEWALKILDADKYVIKVTRTQNKIFNVLREESPPPEHECWKPRMVSASHPQPNNAMKE